MTFGSLALGRTPANRTIPAAPAQPTGSRDGAQFQVFAAALAVSGLMEVLLQRVVYRIGVHIPREGALLQVYDGATFAGDFAFRLSAVLLAVTAALVALHYLRDRRAAVTGALVGAILLANGLVWPLGFEGLAGPVALSVAFAAAWVAGSAWNSPLRAVLIPGALAIALAQFWTGMTLLGHQPDGLATMHLLGEGAIVGAAVLAAVAASGQGRLSRPALGCSLVALVLAAAYLREPSTFAIVSMWATGVTVSLPPAAYLIAFAAAAFAVLVWVRSPATRPLAAGMVLLLVAGLQPQALHHGLTALLGLIFIGAGPVAGQLNSEALDEV